MGLPCMFFFLDCKKYFQLPLYGFKNQEYAPLTVGPYIMGTSFGFLEKNQNYNGNTLEKQDKKQRKETT